MRREHVSPLRHGHFHPPVGGRPLLTGPPRAAANIDSCARLNFTELYATTGIIGQRLSDKAKELAGRPVVIAGYMAPPLDAAADFFVLTRAPMPTCPFCDPLMSWPDDLVLSLQGAAAAFADPDMSIEVAGILDLGRKPDPRTGAVRLVRLLDAEWRMVAKTSPTSPD